MGGISHPVEQPIRRSIIQSDPAGCWITQATPKSAFERFTQNDRIDPYLSKIKLLKLPRSRGSDNHYSGAKVGIHFEGSAPAMPRNLLLQYFKRSSAKKVTKKKIQIVPNDSIEAFAPSRRSHDIINSFTF